MKIREVVVASISMLNQGEKKMLLGAVLLQFIVNLADVIGVALVGAIGSLGVTYVAGFASPDWVTQVLRFIGLDGKNTQEAIVYVAGISGILFIFKSLLSLFLMKRIFRFLANRQARVSVEIAEKLVKAPYSWLKRQKSDQLVYAATDGTNAIFIGVIGNFISVVVDFALLILILAILILIDTSMAISTIVFFGVFTIALYRFVRTYSSDIGQTYQISAIEGREKLATIFHGYKEIFSSKQSEFFLDSFRNSRVKNTNANANAMWLQYIPKATAEIGLVIGAGGIVIFQVWQNSATGGLGTILLFLASASRLTPALMRIQGAMIYMKNYASVADATLTMLEELEGLDLQEVQGLSKVERDESSPVEIKIQEVSFRFPDASNDTLKEVSLEIPSGSITAITGPSGSGKTTLVDLIIGVYSPSQGNILFRNTRSNEWKSSSQIKIAYVTQRPFLIPGSLLENITLGVNEEDVKVDFVEEVIRSSHLYEFVRNLPEGVKTDLSGIASRVSGGELQRISIARALYSKPDLLVVDEGTSALDALSERFVTDFLMTLSGKVTVILIAHRLPAIKGADRIVFLDSGVVQGCGTFTELLKNNPKFAEQVKLLELLPSDKSA